MAFFISFNINRPKKFIIFHVISCIILNIFLLSLINIHNFYQKEEDVNTSLEKRIRDYDTIFSFITKNKTLKKITKKIQLLNGKNINLQEGTSIFGDFLIIHEPKNIKHKDLNRSNVSKPYQDKNITHDWLVDIFYPFPLTKEKTISILITVPFKELLLYTPWQYNNTINITHEKTPSSCFIRKNKTYLAITKKEDYIKTPLFLLCFNLAYTLSVLIFFSIKRNFLFTENEKTIENLKQENSYIFDRYCYISQLLSHISAQEKVNLNIGKTVKELLYINTDNLSKKDLKCFTAISQKEIIIHREMFIIVLWTIINTFIEEIPPKSHFYIDLKEDSTQDNFVKLELFDKIPINLNLHDKITEEKRNHLTFPQGNIDKLIKKLGIFINFSFSSEKGNTVIIAIPQKKRSTPLNKDCSNVLSFKKM